MLVRLVTHGPPIWPRSVDGRIPDAAADGDLLVLRDLWYRRTLETTPMEPCCADPANRESQAISPEQREQARRTSGATPGLQVCRVCGRRHYSLTLDPIAIGVRGQSLGGEG